MDNFDVLNFTHNDVEDYKLLPESIQKYALELLKDDIKNKLIDRLKKLRKQEKTADIKKEIADIRYKLSKL